VPHRPPPTSVTPPSSHQTLVRFFESLSHTPQKAVPSGLEQGTSDLCDIDGHALKQIAKPDNSGSATGGTKLRRKHSNEEKIHPENARWWLGLGDRETV
jgi:hypothetical protein